MKKIAVDAMGGDYAPEEIVYGALQAVKNWQIPVILVGDSEQIAPLVEQAGMSGSPLVELHHASEVIGMDEHPGMAYRKKKDASIVQCAKLVKAGTAGAIVAPGSTGAAVTAGLFGLGRIPGFKRPAIATPLPRADGGVTLLLDSGASADPELESVLQNAVLGHFFMKEVYGISAPKIGLLNIGTEEIKGKPLVTQAFAAMREQSLYHFVGNVEGRDILTDQADVVVCDGFTGNAVLKFGEGVAKLIGTLLKEGIRNGGLRAKLGAWLLAPALRGMLRRVDYAEYGGAPLLGIQGGLVICHGASKRKAITNATKLASAIAEADLSARVQAAVAGGRSGNE